MSSYYHDTSSSIKTDSEVSTATLLKDAINLQYLVSHTTEASFRFCDTNEDYEATPYKENMYNFHRNPKNYFEKLPLTANNLDEIIYNVHDFLRSPTEVPYIYSGLQNK